MTRAVWQRHTDGAAVGRRQCSLVVSRGRPRRRGQHDTGGRVAASVGTRGRYAGTAGADYSFCSFAVAAAVALRTLETRRGAAVTVCTSTAVARGGQAESAFWPTVSASPSAPSRPQSEENKKKRGAAAVAVLARGGARRRGDVGVRGRRVTGGASRGCGRTRRVAATPPWRWRTPPAARPTAQRPVVAVAAASAAPRVATRPSPRVGRCCRPWPRHHESRRGGGGGRGKICPATRAGWVAPPTPALNALAPHRGQPIGKRAPRAPVPPRLRKG